MRLSRHPFALCALLLAAGSAAGQGVDGAWISYRDAYRTMVVFEKYGQAKHLIQHHYQVMPKDRSAPDGLQLTLQGKSTRVNLPLDATGRAVFPLLKAAYDENAVLVLNRPAANYVFRPRVSIAVRPDGVYETGELRAACEQALAYQRHVNQLYRSSKCVGVRFVFPKGMADPGVRLRKGDAAALPPGDGAAFEGDPYEGFRVVPYRFGEAGVKEQLVTQNVPLAIEPVYGK
jgi:hypothetical protein